MILGCCLRIFASQVLCTFFSIIDRSSFLNDAILRYMLTSFFPFFIITSGGLNSRYIALFFYFFRTRCVKEIAVQSPMKFPRSFFSKLDDLCDVIHPKSCFPHLIFVWACFALSRLPNLTSLIPETVVYAFIPHIERVTPTIPEQQSRQRVFLDCCHLV